MYILGVLLVALLGCSATPRWRTTRKPDALDAARLLASDTLGLERDLRPEEIPEIPVRERLRPCCAFGSRLRVRMGAVRIPGLAIENIRSADDIGTHKYDAGQRGEDVSDDDERNGLVYTCRGGFIDTAHVRDYADWTLYLAAEIARRIETGGTIELPHDEGGERRFVLRPVDPELVRIMGLRDVSSSLATWGAFQLSLWHEIATWYDWASFDLFSERASAFSPEDLYSNLLGAKIAAPIITSGNAISEDLFNRAVDAWFDQSLAFLGAVPAEVGEEAMAAVDQHWWDSSAQLPDADLVLRRNARLGTRVEPWLVPTATLDPKLDARLELLCKGNREPHRLRNPSRIPGIDFAQVLTLEIELDESMAELEAFQGYGSPIRQSDFPALVEQIREEMRAEFGPLADSPEIR